MYLIKNPGGVLEVFFIYQIVGKGATRAKCYCQGMHFNVIVLWAKESF
jgi:hypothetical protein